MFTLKSMNKQLISLQLGLREFGLKPIEWKIIKKDKTRFLIQHKDESDFYFIGEVTSQNLNHWKFIQLSGLH